MDQDRQRAEYAAALRAAAERRFGAARAEALRQTIEDVSGWMAEVATFPVDADEPPAFYAEPSS
jgi:hypothetical protein